MRVLIFCALFLAPLCCFAQFSDDFSDGAFDSGSAVWSGDDGHFKVNGTFHLQSDATGATSPVYLQTNSTLGENAYWEFWAKMGFNPTSSNYARIYLFSDESDLTKNLNGVFIRLGHSKKNVALIFSQKGKVNQTLIEGPEKRLDSSIVSVRLKATLDKSGNFNLYSKLDGESDFSLEGSCSFRETIDSKAFGVVCNFTSTRAKLFYFDDFLVRELRDDEQGPVIVDPDIDAPEYDDIIFSEIMANPGSEGEEYIEFYNTTDKTFQLQDCLYYYGDKSYKLPEGEVGPKSYFVLCKTTAVSSFSEDVNAFGVPSFPVMANTGKLLMFATSDDKLVSWFEYSDKMYGDADKKAGGWSLECIDFSNKSNTEKNWTGSVSTDGTPGKENSAKAINPDSELPKISGSETLEGNVLKITFSKPMNRSSLSDINSYLFSNSAFQITNIATDYPKGMFVELTLNQYPAPGEMIELTMSGVRDLSGFALETNNSLMVGEGHEASTNDLVINEILFNPPTGGNEYVEIYNRSNQSYDLRLLSLTSRKPSDGSLNKAWPLSTLPLLIEPGEYLVITQSKDLVCNYYDCREESFFTEPGGMPSLANTSGCAVLLNNRTEEIVDEFAYNEKMHASGISNKKGVALERINPEKPSDDANNWHSASEDSGFGTPGYINSQYSPTEKPNGIDDVFFIAYPSIESDQYRIYYRLDTPGYRCNGFVYDALGRKVNQIANNELIGTEGTLYWNGRENSGKSLTPGIYIIYLEMWNKDGRVNKYRKPVIVR